MKRIRHSIKREAIPQVKLTSLTDRTWYDSNDNLISWTGSTGYFATGFTPSSGDFEPLLSALQASIQA